MGVGRGTVSSALEALIGGAAIGWTAPAVQQAVTHRAGVAANRYTLGDLFGSSIISTAFEVASFVVAAQGLDNESAAIRGASGVWAVWSGVLIASNLVNWPARLGYTLWTGKPAWSFGGRRGLYVNLPYFALKNVYATLDARVASESRLRGFVDGLGTVTSVLEQSISNMYLAALAKYTALHRRSDTAGGADA